MPFDSELLFTFTTQVTSCRTPITFLKEASVHDSPIADIADYDDTSLVWYGADSLVGATPVVQAV